MTYKEEIKNTTAFNVKMEVIRISEAESGRRGYFCRGCRKEMQAVISFKPNRISYFRHDHNAIKGLPKCTYSDETERHKLAKEILLMNKRIKVPTLYKYPPKNINGIPNLISEAKFIEADSVRAEIYFYENEFGEIQYDREFSSDEGKYLLIKPDITFFDKDSNPILLIEIVVTHKISENKLLKLKRLGINTIQITIPKDSPESIGKTLETTDRTKWVYNYEQENNEYISFPESSSKGISSIDEDQRQFFDESYTCRTAQIKNLIRTITICLELQQFRTITGSLESEISRVERNTKEYRDFYEQQREGRKIHLENLRNRIRERVHTKYTERRTAFETEKRKFENEEKEFRKGCVEWNKKNESNLNFHRKRIEQSTSEKHRNSEEKLGDRYGNLETRYNRKRIELESNTESTKRTIREFEDEIAGISRSIEGERRFIREIESEALGMENKIRNIGNIEARDRESLNSKQEYGKQLESKYSKLRIELEERIAIERIQLEKRFDDIYREIESAIKARNFEGHEHTREFKNLLTDLQRVPDFIVAEESNRRIEKAWEQFTSGAYKNWHD